MINLTKEETLKYQLYNVCNYIYLMNVINFLLHLCNFILSLKQQHQQENLCKIYFNCVNVFLFAPLTYYCIKYYILYFVIFSEIYKICFVIFKLFEFYQNYNTVDIILVQIDMYMIYFNIKYIYYNYNCTKETISELCNGWKPDENIKYLY